MRTIDDTIAALAPPLRDTPLQAPPYTPRNGPKIGLAVESMRRHTTDEGWQLFAGLQSAGYRLYGFGLPGDRTDAADIVLDYKPSVVVLQDKREWDVRPSDFREPRARFENVHKLKGCGAFVLTVLKDAQSRPAYHRQSAEETGCHAWVTYYNPRVVKHLAPYVREEHLVRTYHSYDASIVPQYSSQGRSGALLSGAISGAYPLRTRLFNANTPGVNVLKHPGYHRSGSCTPEFLRILCNYKVAICTSSVYGYALRKIVEATACGCAVVTDLPSDEVMPSIDGNLFRVDSDAPTKYIAECVRRLCAMYDPERQAHFADLAWWYDYRNLGVRLAMDIEELRDAYEVRR